MNIKNFSARELSKILPFILKRNFLEWKRLRKEIFDKSLLKDRNWGEKEIEEILASEPVAVFYAHWLKLSQTEENDRRRKEKILGYIKGLFAKEKKNEKEVIKLFIKCELIANIEYAAALKMIDSAISLQALMEEDGPSLQDIFENEKAYKVIVKSAMNSIEWKMSAGMPFNWMCQNEIPKGKKSKVKRAMNEVLSKREKELFS